MKARKSDADVKLWRTGCRRRDGYTADDAVIAAGLDIHDELYGSKDGRVVADRGSSCSPGLFRTRLLLDELPGYLDLIDSAAGFWSDVVIATARPPLPQQHFNPSRISITRPSSPIPAPTMTWW
jgi:hypothetical protein